MTWSQHHRTTSRSTDPKEGRATVFITHRLANTRLADRIIVLDQGRIAQTGTAVLDGLTVDGPVPAPVRRVGH
ncbi:hypothetical protein [Streptomyces sp. AV19]|uniref:hypothetical protein n=1 Tax=Streptomyces sp. AV19 TaxID=2793068 RepID=UPI001F38DDC6|nr:hypothetical protein [Streptomyces sp. AV19]MDG4533285.1 hypothetical protein [Streptomyces sp. AV19]